MVFVWFAPDRDNRFSSHAPFHFDFSVLDILRADQTRGRYS